MDRLQDPVSSQELDPVLITEALLGTIGIAAPSPQVLETGVRRLLYAIFTDGLHRILRCRERLHLIKKADTVEACRWLMEDDHMRPTSFLILCQAFNFDHEHVRFHLIRACGPEVREKIPLLRRYWLSRQAALQARTAPSAPQQPYPSFQESGKFSIVADF